MRPNPAQSVPADGGSFPRSPEKITADWLNGVLHEIGVPADDALESIDVAPTEAGFGALGVYAKLALRCRRETWARRSLCSPNSPPTGLSRSNIVSWR